ncbi:MAG: 2-hydroxyacyl-CoA dehydratase family protein, partial [Spirochaetota bacterium]
MPPVFLAGFPNLIPLPIQVFPEFLICNMDQQLMPHYIDALESFGVPADLCAKNVAEAGVAAEDDYPQTGACAITSNMACDGSIITSSLQMRRIQRPYLPVMMPMRHYEEEVHDFAETEILAAIKFIEEHTGEKYDWNAFYKAAKILNVQNEFELTKWDFFKAPYSPLSGVAESLYRVYSWASGNGLEKLFAKNDRKVVDIMTKCYKKKYIPFKGKTRHRAFVWSCSAAYYTDAPTWLQNCWGIQVILNMDSTMGFNMIDTSDQKKALRDLALLSEKSTMRHHAVGGWEPVNRIWEYAESFNCDMIIFYDQIGCKGMNGVHGLMEDEARKHDFNFLWVEHDLEDPRTVSRRQ